MTCLKSLIPMLPKKVGSLEDEILLEEGDTLELVTGHVTTGKPSRFFFICFVSDRLLSLPGPF